ncbi:hypothetical protein SAMD00019534_026480 [Acytostelium subglobosum LB1]|uniref:hypothetical protein n=1 Tax=Acytostelium subglobosum LB1 TaxID=1410327 RepID=UPI000644F8EF|nr:hypothetical protein SAMD00019534_026480 [Acytostelium subglobosum LB1]GAM19473.1 hypothetical protein SAMD00019534_026480 [Acytostelium subglobosum LB1]|eukprot:XP_012757400.1 hypothetical protein SAMD00019534_026480 [Acytostelium subglobosum LB1]
MFFNTKNLPCLKTFQQQILRNHLKSFNSIIYKSIEKAPIDMLYLSYDDFPHHYTTSYGLIEKQKAANQPLDLSSIPLNVGSLTFGNLYKEPLLPHTIPSTITILNLGNGFSNLLFPGTIPTTVTSLDLGNKFNHPLVPGSIPASVRQLRFGTSYDKQLPPGWIPSSVEDLELSSPKTHQLEVGSIPSSVRLLKLSYVHTLTPGIIPKSSSIERLTLMNYNKPIVEDALPEGIKYIDFGINFSNVITLGALPMSLTEMVYSHTYTPLDVEALPPSLTRLTLNVHPQIHTPFPNTITHLVLNYHSVGSTLEFIPDSVTHLTLGNRFNVALYTNDDPKPGFIERFFWGKGEQDDKNITSNLPPHLESLILGEMYDQPIPRGVLPQSLRKLVLGRDFNQILTQGALPDALTHITLGPKMARTDVYFPPALTHISFPMGTPIKMAEMPLNVKHLEILIGHNLTKVLRVEPSYSLTLCESLYAGGFVSNSMLDRLIETSLNIHMHIESLFQSRVYIH